MEIDRSRQRKRSHKNGNGAKILLRYWDGSLAMARREHPHRAHYMTGIRFMPSDIAS